MATIDLRCPVRSERVRAGFQPHWRTVYVYRCSDCGNEVRVYANSFRGRTPEPGTGGIVCPHCKDDWANLLKAVGE